MSAARWRPSPLVGASIALHAVGAAALAVSPASWPVIGAVSLADHAVMFLAGVLPRSRVLGPNLTRLPPASARGAVALTFDDGPDPVTTPAVLDLLERRGARATFFCIGRRAAAHPDVVREIARRGHAVGNHTWGHPSHFAWLGPRALEREMRRAQETLGALAGAPPLWFRAPAGIRSPLLDPVLVRCGLRLASWTRRAFDTVRRDPGRVSRRLTAGLRQGDVLLLHDGGPGGTPFVLDVLGRVLDRIEAAGLRCVTLPTS